MKLQEIATVLKKTALDWKIAFVERERCALFYTKGKELETGITSSRCEATITIYKPYGKELGDASFTIQSLDGLQQKIDDAIVLCSTAKKKAYPMAIPKKGTVQLADKKIVDAFAAGTQEKLLLGVWQKMGIPLKNVRIAACELSLSASKATILNSTGKSAASRRTRFFIECPLTAFGKNELEYLATMETVRLSDFQPAAFIKENAAKALDVLNAAQFAGVQEGRIVLSGDALQEFWSPDISFNPVIFHGGARAVYMTLSRFLKGKQIGTGFSLYSNPSIDYLPSSSAFDGDGSASKRVQVIKDGKWHQFLASQRYAHYLSVPVTGAPGAVELSCKKTFNDLDGCVEVVSFSSFVPNGPSGDFSAEIRLGYLYKDGKKIPVRSAMFTGNVFSMLSSMAGKGLTEMDGYKGPALLRFDEGVSLVGC